MEIPLRTVILFMLPIRVQYRNIFMLAALTLLAGICAAQNGGNNAQDLVMNLMRQQIGLDSHAPNEKNPDGLSIQFSRIAEVPQPDGHLLQQYRLLVPGAPEKQEYILAIWRIGSTVKYSMNVSM